MYMVIVEGSRSVPTTIDKTIYPWSNKTGSLCQGTTLHLDSLQSQSKNRDSRPVCKHCMRASGNPNSSFDLFRKALSGSRAFSTGHFSRMRFWLTCNIVSAHYYYILSTPNKTNEAIRLQALHHRPEVQASGDFRWSANAFQFDSFDLLNLTSHKGSCLLVLVWVEGVCVFDCVCVHVCTVFFQRIVGFKIFKF